MGGRPLADQPVTAAGGDMVLVAERRDRQIPLRLAVLARPGLGELLRPALGNGPLPDPAEAFIENLQCCT